MNLGKGEDSLRRLSLFCEAFHSFAAGFFVFYAICEGGTIQSMIAILNEDTELQR
jgi:hypothetical protein